jgi:hypothetical protein
MSDSSLVPIEESAVTFQTLKAISNTEFVPKGLRGRPEAMLAAVLAGRELGLGPMASLRGIDMIEGSPHLSGETIMALVRRAGHRIRIVHMNPQGATVIGERLEGGQVVESGEFSFLEEDARAAGLLGKNNWKSYAAVMMAWRAITMCGRFMFADLLGGGVKLTYTADELGGQGEPEVFDGDILPEGEELAVLVADADVAAAEQKSLTVTRFHPPVGEKRALLKQLGAMDDPLAVPTLARVEATKAADREITRELDEARNEAERVALEGGIVGALAAGITIAYPPDPTFTAEVKDEETVKPASYAELTSLLGTFPEWKGSTAEGLERNVRRIFQLMQGLGLWEIKRGDNQDPFHAGLVTFGTMGRRDPDKWGVDVTALRGDPLQHFASLGKKQNMQAFAATTVWWAETRLEKGKP